MRIVSGEFRGKAITTPAGDKTRPTSDRARQAVFNILEHAAWSPGVRDLRVIDLFAGSGALDLIDGIRSQARLDAVKFFEFLNNSAA